MILSDLLGTAVYCAGERLGCVVDARFVLRGKVEGTLAQAELVGLLVGPRAGVAFLGYERRDVDRPALIDRFFDWRQRGSFLVDWADVDHIDDDRVELVTDHTRWSPRIVSSSAGTAGP